MNLVFSTRRLCFWPPLLFCLAAAVLSPARLAAAKPNKSDVRDSVDESNPDAPVAKSNKRDDKAEAKAAKANSVDAEARTMARLRERLEVADDAEWNVIAERVTKVEDLRRNLWTGGGKVRPNLGLGDKGKRSAVADASAHPEQEALRTAVNDKLTDAEIKSRLARAHEINQQNEAKLSQAQAELRAVLTVRQEAVVVMAGLLPP